MHDDLAEQLARILGVGLTIRPRAEVSHRRYKPDGTPYTRFDYELAFCMKNVRKCNDSHKLRYTY